jgi:serine phosphatase RsbU (regulator of sigma subunit)
LAPTQTQVEPRELLIRDLEGRTVSYPLEPGKDRIVLGRLEGVELCYPDDIGLSRKHLAITRVTAGEWQVEDLASKNGTLLNGARLEKPLPFRPGDRITAGHLTIEFGEASAASMNTVVFVEHADSTTATTVVANLDGVLGPPAEDLDKTHVMTGNPQTRALIRAGRELAGHRPLSEVFKVILDLSVEAVMAGRGVLLTLEGDQLRVKAARGDKFQISATVRDRVLKNKESVLVRDTLMDQALKDQMSIVEQRVRSMIAVPLQTNDRVIGLIYVDSPNQVREFTRDDLNLLTVMANVAAIRIEHARLNEIEVNERAMANELEQAAQIQRKLLPAAAPTVEGLDIAANATACRGVAGDYYDFLRFPDGRIGMLVGDVAGKGMPAALLMSSLQARVPVVFDESGEVARRVARLNRTTCGNCPDNRFITFFIAVVDPATGEVTYCNAGHNPPLLARAGGATETLADGGVMLGILPLAQYQEGRVQLEKGDVLVLFSDGVTEATDAQDHEFGEERLAQLVASLSEKPAAEIVERIHQAVAEFTQGAPPADDITVVVARRT